MGTDKQMKVKGIIFEDFVNYRYPCMTLQMPFCSFKCDKECGMSVCQNSALASAPIKEWTVHSIIREYLHNHLTSAICFQGLEPFDSFDDLYDFIKEARIYYYLPCDIVIYTGYNKDEIQDKIDKLKKFKNIVVKFGRYIPGHEPHFDSVLGVSLSSPNQYAERIS